jgi:hypothetical protein
LRQALHAKTLGFVHPTTKEWCVLILSYLKIFRIVSKNGEATQNLIVLMKNKSY